MRFKLCVKFYNKNRLIFDKNKKFQKKSTFFKKGIDNSPPRVMIRLKSKYKGGKDG